MNNDMKNGCYKDFLRVIIIILLVVTTLEIGLFNFRHWQSVNNIPVTAGYICSDNLQAEDINAFRVMSVEEMPYIEVGDLDLDIENITMDITFPELGVTAVETVGYHLEIIDQGNRNRYMLPSMEFMHLVPQSHFAYPDLYGKAKNIRLCFDDLRKDQLIRVEYVILNSVVPLMISKKRMLVLFTFMLLMYLLGPRGFLHSYKAGERSRMRTISVIVLLLSEIAFSWWAINVHICSLSLLELCLIWKTRMIVRNAFESVLVMKRLCGIPHIITVIIMCTSVWARYLYSTFLTI